jgi:steroid 5-alpha reductase family enzyme
MSLIAAIYLVPYTEYGALTTVLTMTLFTAVISFVFSLVTKDYSWTDRLWSTTPIAYAWMYAYAGKFNVLVTLGALLVTIWGARLSFNFARRDGYIGGEDYRWKILHGYINHPVAWTLFNLLFIALYQQILFVCFTLPLYLMSELPQSSISLTSLIAIMFFFSFLTIETIADQQQYMFQQSKYGLLPKKDHYKDDYEKGFRTTGLFSFSRHPNYLGELGVWWSMYLLGASSIGSLLNWTIFGPIMLTLLFIGSTWFTEIITSKKYADYAAYKKDVWPIFPKFKR